MWQNENFFDDEKKFMEKEKREDLVLVKAKKN